MSITLPALLKLANFPIDKVDELVKNIDFVTDEEKFKLSNMAWQFIAQRYFLQLSLEHRRILDEVKQGKRLFNQNDLEEVKAKLVSELAKKLEMAQSQESIDEVKEQIEKYKTKSLPQDKSDIASSVGKPQV